MHSRIRFILLCGLLVFLYAVPALSRDGSSMDTMRVSTSVELFEAVADAKAGQVILLADGVYEDDRILRMVDKHGTAEQPIVIAAENLGRAVIGGSMAIEIHRSSHIVLNGLTLITSGESAS